MAMQLLKSRKEHGVYRLAGWHQRRLENIDRSGAKRSVTAVADSVAVCNFESVPVDRCARSHLIVVRPALPDDL